MLAQCNFQREAIESKIIATGNSDVMQIQKKRGIVHPYKLTVRDKRRQKKKEAKTEVSASRGGVGCYKQILK